MAGAAIWVGSDLPTPLAVIEAWTKAGGRRLHEITALEPAPIGPSTLRGGAISRTRVAVSVSTFICRDEPSGPGSAISMSAFSP